MRGKYRDFLYTLMYPLPNQHHSPEWCIFYSWPLWTIMNLGWHVITQSTCLHFHPRLVCSYCGLGEYINIMTYINHYDILQVISAALKILCALPNHPSLSQPLSITDYFYCLHSFAFSRMSYNWNHIVYSLFRLASFT